MPLNCSRKSLTLCRHHDNPILSSSSSKRGSSLRLSDPGSFRTARVLVPSWAEGILRGQLLDPRTCQYSTRKGGNSSQIKGVGKLERTILGRLTQFGPKEDRSVSVRTLMFDGRFAPSETLSPIT
jgi:hypothetical protein